MHIYDGPDGNKYPSVTTIIHEILIHPGPLLAWSNSLGFKKMSYQGAMDETSAKGTAVHDFMYAHMKNIKEVKSKVPLKFAQEIYYIVYEAKKFFIEHKMSPETTIDAEVTLIDTELGYAGTLDWVGITYYKTGHPGAFDIQFDLNGDNGSDKERDEEHDANRVYPKLHHFIHILLEIHAHPFGTGECTPHKHQILTEGCYGF